MKISVFDIGFRYTKAKSNKAYVCQPSVIGDIKQLFEQNIKDNYIIYDQEYFIGHLAEKHSDIKYHSIKEDKSNTWTTKILIKTALGLISPKDKVNVVSGLPIEYYFSQKDSMITEILSINIKLVLIRLLFSSLFFFCIIYI